MKKVLLISGVLAAVGVQAQTRSSFLEVDVISDILVSVSNAGLTYDVSLGNNGTFTYQSQNYQITDVIGFWVLSDDDDLTVTNANFTGNFGPWVATNSNSGTGAIAGWKSNPNDGITAGGTEQFNYSALSVANVERMGFHVRIDGMFPGTQGNTGYITVVPEPATLLGLGVGLAAFLRRRKK